MPKNKRDREWKERLARQLQVDEPPQGYFQAVQNAFDSLPEELPVKARPWRGFARACAALAACAVLVAAGAFGLNRAAPGVAESLPGVGQLFQRLNGESPSPSPVPEESRLEETSPQDVAPFQPVSVRNDAEATGASLTVENAWCDGLYLHLSLSLEMADPLWQNEDYLSTQEIPYQEETETALLVVDGENAAFSSLAADRLFTRVAGDTGGKALFTAEWVAALPQPAEDRQQLSVDVSLPFLTGLESGDGGAPLSSLPGYDLAFFVTVDASRTFVWNQDGTQPAVGDNGVALSQWESSTTAARAVVEAPFFGRASYALLTTSQGEALESAALPLGIYPQLTTPDGQVVEEAGAALYDPDSEGPYALELYWQAPPVDVPYLVLTFYEYPPLSSTSYNYIRNNRVTAEFTIDLETGTIAPSQHYLAAGREKLELLESQGEDRSPALENGFICAEPSRDSDGVTVTLYSPETEYRSLAVYCYSGDTLVCAAYSQPEEAYNAATPEGVPYYADGSSTYREDTVGPPYTAPGTAYKRMVFTAYNGDGADITRLSLVDMATGQVLVEDIDKTFRAQFDQVFGTRLQEQAALEEAAQSQNPNASPQPLDAAGEAPGEASP